MAAILLRGGGGGDELKRPCFRGKPACFRRQPCPRSWILTASQHRSFTYVFTRTPYWASSTARARLIALIAPYKVKNTCMKISLFAWWHHQMEPFSALLAICAGNSPVTGEFPAQRPVTRSFNIFFDLRLNKRLSKQSWGWWFETLPYPLWRHCNSTICNNSRKYVPYPLITISRPRKYVIW